MRLDPFQFGGEAVFGGEGGLYEAVQERGEASAEGGHFRAVVVDAAVGGHEEFDGFEAAVAPEGRLAFFVHELVGEVLDGVAEFFEGVSGFRSDATPNAGSLGGDGCGRSRESKVMCCGPDHTLVLILFLGQFFDVFR